MKKLKNTMVLNGIDFVHLYLKQSKSFPIYIKIIMAKISGITVEKDVR